jgi:carboxypeptidase Taq
MTAATTTPSTLTTAPPPSPPFEEASEAYKKLVAKLRAITQLNRASSVLGYDRMVFMSHDPETAKERGAQISALASIIHEKSVDKEIKELILKAKDDLIHAQASHPSLYADEARLLELELKSFVENERVPAELAAKAAALGSTAYGAWMKAKADNDYASFQDVLGDCFETAKEVADAQRGDKDVSLYTQMLDQYEMGLPASGSTKCSGRCKRPSSP